MNMGQVTNGQASFHADGFFAVTMVSSGSPIGGPIEDGEGLTTGGTMGGAIGGAITPSEVTEAQQKVLDLMIEDSRISQRAMAKKLDINLSALLKHIDVLKEKGVLERIGGTRGYWKVKQ